MSPVHGNDSFRYIAYFIPYVPMYPVYFSLIIIVIHTHDGIINNKKSIAYYTMTIK